MGLGLIITAGRVLFFLRAHNDRAALVLPTFQLLGHSKYPASTALPALVHPESSCPAFDAIECDKMVREMDFLRVPVTQERLKPSEGKLIGFDG